MVRSDKKLRYRVTGLKGLSHELLVNPLNRIITTKQGVSCKLGLRIPQTSDDRGNNLYNNFSNHC